MSRGIGTVLVEPALDRDLAARGHIRLLASKHAPMNPALDLDRIGVHVRRRHHVGHDLPLGLEKALMQRLLDVLKLARAGLALHRVSFQELPDAVEHSIVEAPAGLRGS